MKSKSLAGCSAKGHKLVRHSPDGVDVVLECPVCCMAWLVKGITGEEIRLYGLYGSYEARLLAQKAVNP